MISKSDSLSGRAAFLGMEMLRSSSFRSCPLGVIRFKIINSASAKATYLIKQSNSIKNSY